MNKTSLENIECFSSGMNRFDKCLGGGFYAGKCYAIAARKKTGKTIFASSISHNLNKAGVKHLLIATHTTPREINQRNIAREINRNSSCFLTEERNEQSLIDAVADWCDRDPGNTFYAEAFDITFEKLKSLLKDAIREHQIKGFILDHFQNISCADPDKIQAQHFAEMAQWIADFCKENEVFCIVMAQMNQDTSNSNIRGGEGIRLAFDQVYEIKKVEDTKNRWVQMLDTRYTDWKNIGSEENPALFFQDEGPHFFC